MFFLPFQVDLPLGRLPFLTILIALLCIIIYGKQVSATSQLEEALHGFCVQQTNDRDFIRSLTSIKSPKLNSCEALIYYIHSSSNPQETIKQLGRIARPLQGVSHAYSQHYVTTILQKKYNTIHDQLPLDLTEKLAYHPNSYDIINMFTSQFAHADIFHLIGNLLFFFAFAASLEIVLGATRFLLMSIVLSIGVSLAFSLYNIGVSQPMPTIGLSGVVMGMIGIFSYLMPSANIRCLLVILLYFRIFTIPAWILAIWFVGWDFYNLFNTETQSEVNLVAHVSGAFLGYSLAAIFFRSKKKLIKQQLIKIQQNK